MSTNKQSVESKIADLEKQVAWFDSDEFALEEAIERYEKAHTKAEEIMHDLETLKNTITRLDTPTT